MTSFRHMAWVLLIAAATPAAAQQPFEPPRGCEGVLTIQHRGCLVTNVWSCAADPDGVRRVGLFDEVGLLQVRTVDAEFQWLHLRHAGGLSEELVQPARDPESLSELIGSGTDRYDFTMRPANGMAVERYVGEDRITGEAKIDGEPLLTTAFSYEVRGPGGEVRRQREGRQYVSAAHRIFVLGRSWDTSAPEEISDRRPVAFTYPGDRGFLSPDPQYDCEATVASLGAAPAREGT